MGIVQRQSFWNLIFTYMGVIVGYANKVWFYRIWLSESEFGVIELLLAVMVVGAEFSTLGVSKIITRFFPYFSQDPKKQGQFASFALSYALLGFIGLTLLLLAFKPLVMYLFGENSPLFSRYYLFLIPLTLAYAAYKVLQAFSQALLKSVVPIFAFQFALRMFQMGLIFCYYWNWVNFEGLLHGFIWGYYLPAAIILVYLLWLRKFRLAWTLRFWQTRIARIILVYGLFATLADASMILLGKIDAVMLGQIKGEIEVGAYMVAFYIATLVAIPARSIANIVMPLLAIRIKERNWAEIGQMYQKAAMASLLLGVLFFIGIWVNIDTFFEISPKHSHARNAAIIAGIGFVFNVAAGPNRQLILVSRYFRFDFWLNMTLLILAIFGNALLIPRFGLSGAAIATAMVMVGYNLGGVLFIGQKMGLYPYTYKTLLAVLVSILTLLIGLNIPATGSPWSDLLLRSGVVTAVFGGLVLSLRLLPDANQLLARLWRRFGPGTS